MTAQISSRVTGQLELERLQREKGRLHAKLVERVPGKFATSKESIEKQIADLTEAIADMQMIVDQLAVTENMINETIAGLRDLPQTAGSVFFKRQAD